MLRRFALLSLFLAQSAGASELVCGKSGQVTPEKSDPRARQGGAARARLLSRASKSWSAAHQECYGSPTFTR